MGETAIESDLSRLFVGDLKTSKKDLANLKALNTCREMQYTAIGETLYLNQLRKSSGYIPPQNQKNKMKPYRKDQQLYSL